MKKLAKYQEPLIIKMTSHKSPTFKEVLGKDWVYFGEKNDYPQFLLNTFYNASKHNAIVNGKTKYIAGGGWGDAGKTLVNSDGESLDSVTWKISLDKEIYRGFALEVIPTNGGKKAEYRHVDFSKVRSNKDGTRFYYTKTWHTKSGMPMYDPRANDDWTEYEPFDKTNRAEPQLIYYKCYSPGLDIYPLPEYQAALRYIELEYQIANYWYNRVKNGFMPSAILNFYMTQPTDDEMEKLENKIKAKLTSTDNAGQFILNFANNKDSAADVQQLSPPELGAEYEALNTTLQTEIFTGHGITNGMLFGIKEAGQLGGRTELIEANELFQNRYVTPEQLKLEMFFAEYVFPFIGVKEGNLQKLQPIGLDVIGNERLFSLLTQDEQRLLIGKEVIVKDKKSAEAEKIISNVNSLSPLVANEVMKSLTTNEIRSLVGLPPIKGMDKIPTPVEPQKAQEFSKEKTLLEKLRGKGKKRKIKEVIYSRPVTFEMSKDLKASEEELRMTFAKEKNPIIIGGTSPVGVLKGNPSEIISVVYTYEWATGFSDSDITTSRDFCIEMRNMTKEGVTWKREDIDTLDNETGDPEVSDVWESRGGWYNDDGVAIPHCRHLWHQKVIREIA